MQPILVENKLRR